MMRRLPRVFAFVIGALTLTIACQDKSDSVKRLTAEQFAANRDCHFGPEPVDASTLDERAVTGQLTVYTSIPPSQYETYLKDFNAKCPNIKITLLYQPPGKLTEQVLTDKLAPQADVIWGVSPIYLVLMGWYDLLSPYSPAHIEHIQPRFRDTNTPPYWIGFDAWMIGLCVDPGQLQERDLPFPIAWSDLANPVYQDQIIVHNPFLTSTGFMMITHMLRHYGEIDGWAFLDALHHNIARYAKADEEPCDRVATGEKPIGISHAWAGVRLKMQGAPMELVFPAGLSAWDMEASALVAKERIQPAAKTFLDWVISKTAMQAYAEHYAIIARKDVNAPIPKGFPREPSKHLFDRDFLWDAAHRQRILKTLKERYRGHTS